MQSITKGVFFGGKSKSGFLNPKRISRFFFTKIQKRITNPKNAHSQGILTSDQIQI